MILAKNRIKCDAISTTYVLQKVIGGAYFVRFFLEMQISIRSKVETINLLTIFLDGIM